MCGNQTNISFRECQTGSFHGQYLAKGYACEEAVQVAKEGGQNPTVWQRSATSNLGGLKLKNYGIKKISAWFQIFTIQGKSMYVFPYMCVIGHTAPPIMCGLFQEFQKNSGGLGMIYLLEQLIKI